MPLAYAVPTWRFRRITVARCLSGLTFSGREQPHVSDNPGVAARSELPDSRFSVYARTR